MRPFPSLPNADLPSEWSRTHHDAIQLSLLACGITLLVAGCVFIPILAAMVSTSSSVAKVMFERKKRAFEECTQALDELENSDDYKQAKLLASADPEALSSEQRRILSKWSTLSADMDKKGDEAANAELALNKTIESQRKAEHPIAMLQDDKSGKTVIRPLKFSAETWLHQKSNKVDINLKDCHARESKHYTIYQKMALNISASNEPSSTAADNMKEYAHKLHSSGPEAVHGAFNEMYQLIEEGTCSGAAKVDSCATFTCHMVDK